MSKDESRMVTASSWRVLNTRDREGGICGPYDGAKMGPACSERDPQGLPDMYASK